MNNNTMYCKRIAEELNELATADDLEALYDYINEALDFEFRVDLQKNYRSARIAITLGGPNVFIDTRSGCVELYWGNDKAEWHLSQDADDTIDNILREFYGCY